ncbi:MAG: hypothetical protein IJH34_06660 [Romboutsia sp.]|nr:hypothetical protein [Romboutsia sp.]
MMLNKDVYSIGDDQDVLHILEEARGLKIKQLSVIDEDEWASYVAEFEDCDVCWQVVFEDVFDYDYMEEDYYVARAFLTMEEGNPLVNLKIISTFRK